MFQRSGHSLGQSFLLWDFSLQWPQNLYIAQKCEADSQSLLIVRIVSTTGPGSDRIALKQIVNI